MIDSMQRWIVVNAHLICLHSKNEEIISWLFVIVQKKLIVVGGRESEQRAGRERS